MSLWDKAGTINGRLDQPVHINWDLWEVATIRHQQGMLCLVAGPFFCTAKPYVVTRLGFSMEGTGDAKPPFMDPLGDPMIRREDR